MQHLTVKVVKQGFLEYEKKMITRDKNYWGRQEVEDTDMVKPREQMNV